MKKLLLLILTILFLVLDCFAVLKGINLGVFKVYGYKEIQKSKDELNEKINKASEIEKQTYPSEVNSLEEAIDKLKASKQEYENKKAYSTNENDIISNEIKEYKIHYLWTKLGDYKKETNLKSLNFDLKTTTTKDVYDLNFTVVGEYDSVTDFIYEIENDEDLKFDIQNFIMQQYQKSNTVTVTSESSSSKTYTTNPFESIITSKEQSVVSTTRENTNKNAISSTNTTAESNADNNDNIEGNEKQTNNDNKVSSITVFDPKNVEATFTVKSISITLD